VLGIASNRSARCEFIARYVDGHSSYRDLLK
jgi:hypothetical protein